MKRTARFFWSASGASCRRARNPACCGAATSGAYRWFLSARLSKTYRTREPTPRAERLWPNQLPEELGQGILRALGKERQPEAAALLAALTEHLARLAVARSDF